MTMSSSPPTSAHNQEEDEAAAAATNQEEEMTMAVLKLSNHKSVLMRSVSGYQWSQHFSDLTIKVSCIMYTRP